MGDETIANRQGAALQGFDGLIGQLREIVGSLGAGAGVPSADVPRELAMPDAATLPFAHGPHAGRGIVLKSRAAVELGGAQGSCLLVLSTSDTSLVHDGRVTLAGPDISEMTTASEATTVTEAPFAQVILVAGAQMTGDCHGVSEDCANVKDYIDGYFLRTGAGEITARVSNDLAAAGFSLAHLGGALRELVLAEVERAEAVEVVFVTSSREDVSEVAVLRAEAAEVSHDLRKAAWAEKGVDIDCPSGGHCGACADKEVCDRIRDIERLRDAVKEGMDQ